MATLRDFYRRYSVAVAIEGVGDDASKSGGLAYFYGDTPSGAGASDYEWTEALVDKPAEAIEDSINVWTGGIQSSAFTFELAFTDAVARAVYVKPRPSYTLGAALTSSAFSTTVQVLDLAGVAVTSLAGEVVYFLDEAIKLGTHTSGGTYTGCTRAYFGTFAQAHLAGEFGFTRNPYTRHRLVRLIIYDHDADTVETKWRGFVDATETVESGTTVLLRTIGFFAAIKDAALNRGAPRLDIVGFTYQAGNGAVELAGTAEHAPRIRKSSAGISTIPIQAGDTLVLATSSANEVSFAGPAVTDIGAPSFELDEGQATEIGGTLRQPWLQDAFEVFYTDRLFQSSPTSRGGPSTADLEKPLNPVHIAMGFATSTSASSATAGAQDFDAFGSKVGLGLAAGIFDLDAIEATVDANPGEEIDRLGPLGWDGAEFSFWKVTQDVLLIPRGKSWTITEDGRIAIGRKRAVDIAEYCTAISNRVRILGRPHNRLVWRVARENQFAQVTADIGGLPWREPQKALIESRDGRTEDSLRRGAFSADAELRFDMRTFAPRPNLEQLPGRLINEAVTGYYGLPVIGVRVPPSEITGADYGLLKPISLNGDHINTAWLIDPDGERVKFSAAGRWLIGRIVGRRYSLTTGTYELDLLLTNYAAGEVARWRAPAAIVDGNPSTATITVVGKAFHTAADDTSFFAVGDAIECWNQDGTAIASTLAKITAVTATTITLDTDISALLSGDEIIRLADLDDYNDNATSSHLSCDERVFCYYADAAETTGDDNETADIYA